MIQFLRVSKSTFVYSLLFSLYNYDIFTDIESEIKFLLMVVSAVKTLKKRRTQ